MEEFFEKRGEILERLKTGVSAGRFEHSVLTGEVARKLAERHGLDPREAELAGLAHDIAKEFSEEENRRYVEKYGLAPELLEEKARKYVHADVGAEVVREMGLGGEIANAVRLHTIPEAGMGKFEKAIFLADKIGRVELKEGLEELPGLAFEDLDRAMLFFLEKQAVRLREKGIEQHERTKKLMEELAR